MEQRRNDIISALKQELLQMQGFQPSLTVEAEGILPMMADAFPQKQFPLSRIHEFICDSRESVAATSGFLSGLVSRLMHKRGFVIWVSLGQDLYPPGLLNYDLDPSRIIFIDCRKEKELLWVLEETLKCKGLIAAIAIIPGISFTESRRLQLAVEKSGVTGFVICTRNRSLSATAAVVRWKVESAPSYLPDHLPGIGFPVWNIELLKVRNGKPGKWKLCWKKGRFNELEPAEDTGQVNESDNRKAV